MRLIRFVAVACMVAVSVASLGCGESEESTTKKPEATPSAANSNVAEAEVPSTESETATTGVTPVSLTISGMA